VFLDVSPPCVFILNPGRGLELTFYIPHAFTSPSSVTRSHNLSMFVCWSVYLSLVRVALASISSTSPTSPVLVHAVTHVGVHMRVLFPVS